MGLKESGLRGSLRNVSVGIDAIPDSAIAQYDATQESYADGESFSTITDQIGGADMTGGSGEFTSSGIGGNASYDLQGFSDLFSAGGDLIIQDSYTVLAVIDLVDDSSQSRVLDRDSNSFTLYWNDGNDWGHIGPSGDLVSGSTNSSVGILGATKDGAEQTIREDGSETGSITDAATGSSSEPNIQGVDAWNGLIGEIIFYDPVLSSSELEDEEQRLANKWGISI